MISSTTEYKPIGHLGKSFGLEGFIRIRLNKAIALHASKILSKGNAVFVHIQAFKIPFLIEEFDPEQELIKLQKVNQDGIDELLGCALFLPQDKLPDLHPEAVDTDLLVGFSIHDTTFNTTVGVIDRIEEYPAHPMAIVVDRDQEILVPMVEVWIRDIDPANHILFLELPDGLISSTNEEE